MRIRALKRLWERSNALIPKDALRHSQTVRTTLAATALSARFRPAKK